ncbi:MAG: hypothetical protein Roseis3KO_46590 [Roseivirga sp.]
MVPHNGITQENMRDDKSDLSGCTIAYSWNGINLTDNEGKSRNKFAKSGSYAARSPDGSQLIFSSTTLDAKRSIYVVNKDDSSLKRTVSHGTQPAWSKAENTNNGDLPAYGNQDRANSYLGQKPPGLIPEVFAPDVVSIKGKNASGISISPDLDEIYFSAQNEDEQTSIYFSKLKGNQWTPAKRADFTNGRKNEELYPFVSPYDNRIYFTALDSIFSDEKIWYVNRLEDSWSDAIRLDSPVNDDLVFYINQAKNGDLFYTSISKGKMYSAPNKNGAFPEVEEVEVEFGHHGFISPSQDYLLVYTRNTENANRNDHDIYVCFKEKDGTWTSPISFGNEVNSSNNEGSPSISPDGKYMFFGRDEGNGTANFYWVSTEIIERLRPDGL